MPPRSPAARFWRYCAAWPAALSRDREATLHGFVEDLGPLYARADVAVIPMRAVGGTRMTMLAPYLNLVLVVVVATHLGVEGIDARDEIHL